MSRTHAEDFKNTGNPADRFTLPDEFAARFHVLECLAENERGNTYLLTEKDGGKLFVLKCYLKSVWAGENKEGELLRGLSHKGLPSFETEFDDGETLFVLREYAPGFPLDRTLDETDEIAVPLIINIASQLCDVLSYLHSQSPPIIHRDIKPANIIINPDDNSIKLIDFGISRRYSENLENDTEYFGTKKFSPPEQYGFSQTDGRSDIYAMGVLLRFMLTGKTDGQIQDKALARIVEKCTNLAPKDRYQSADALKHALLKYRKREKTDWSRVIASVAVLCLVFTSGILVGRYVIPAPDTKDYNTGFSGEPSTIPDSEASTMPNATPVNNEPYTFSDAMVEKAVRAVLGKNADEIIYQNELDDVTELYFAGENVAANEEEFVSYVVVLDRSADKKYGSLKDLSDLRHMKKLDRLILHTQPIEDLTPLADCPSLTRTDLNFCNEITDLSPLGNCKWLDILNVSGCGGVKDISVLGASRTIRIMHLRNLPSADLSGLESITSLKELLVGQMPLNSISELGDLSHVEWLELPETMLNSLNGIENFTLLEHLGLERCAIEDFSPLDGLPALRELTISPGLEPYMDTMNRNDVNVIVRD